MIEVFVQGVSVLAPGLVNWAESKKVFSGEVPYQFSPMLPFNPDILPATERRRSSETVRWALTVGKAALDMSGLSGEETATVFASSDGDGQIINQICATLASDDPVISPTRFHNSVHNAAAGYWSIANHSQQASNSLASFNSSFAMGLLEAAAQSAVEKQPVLLVSFDLPFPEPLDDIRQIDYGFAVALVLSPTKTSHTLMKWQIEFIPKNISVDVMHIPELLRNNPAARCWALLESLAKGSEKNVMLEISETSHLQVKCGR